MQEWGPLIVIFGGMAVIGIWYFVRARRGIR